LNWLDAPNDFPSRKKGKRKLAPKHMLYQAELSLRQLVYHCSICHAGLRNPFSAATATAAQWKLPSVASTNTI
jgi:hypothetical protein